MSYLIVRTVGVQRLPPRTVPRRGSRCRCAACRLRRGLSLYRRIERRGADRVVRVRCRRRIPTVHVNLGRLRGLIYSSRKGRGAKRRTYIHFMRHEPWLTCDVSGRQLYILGGRYRVTSRGIEG